LVLQNLEEIMKQWIKIINEKYLTLNMMWCRFRSSFEWVERKLNYFSFLFIILRWFFLIIFPYFSWEFLRLDENFYQFLTLKVDFECIFTWFFSKLFVLNRVKNIKFLKHGFESRRKVLLHPVLFVFFSILSKFFIK
jgi:hypothetical protein